jgi:hypothetical protein
LVGILGTVNNSGPHYVMFNNLPRIGDAKRFITLVAEARAPRPAV